MTWGRLALLQAAGESEELLAKTAQVFGYEAVYQAEHKTPVWPLAGSPSLMSLSPELEPESDVTSIDQPSALWVRVVQHQRLDTTPHQQQPEFLTDSALRLIPSERPQGTYQFTKPQPLLTLAQLTPFLLNNLGIERASKRLDQRALTRRLAHGKALPRLPRLYQQRWPTRLQILLDAAPHLEPFWADFEYIANYLRDLLGKEAVEVLRFDDQLSQGNQLWVTPWLDKQKTEYKPWALPASEVAILILSDLGFHADSTRSSGLWWQVAQALRCHPAPVLTFSPQLSAQGQSERIEVLKPQAFTDGVRLGRYLKQGGFQLPEPHESIEQALCFLAALPIMDVGLLRRLRLELAWGNSTVEALLWNHAKTQRTGLGLRLRDEHLHEYQQRYLQQFKHPTQAPQFWRIVKQHHADAFEGLKQLEAWNECLLEQKTDESLTVYLQSLSATLKQHQKHSSFPQALIQQCRSFLRIIPKNVWQSEQQTEAYALLAMAYEDELKTGQMPDCLAQAQGFDPSRLQWLLDEDAQQDTEVWQVIQLDSEGLIQIQRKLAAEPWQIPLVEFEALKSLPPTCQFVGTPTPPATLLNKTSQFQLTDFLFDIRSSHAHLVLDTLPKPAWTSRIWRNEQGLRAVIPWRGEEVEVNWKPSERSVAGYWDFPAPFGEDEFGLYADLQIKSITQRFRFIPAGTFLMGSPKDEPERSGNETQHEVTLSQGFWLADTTITQELWQAVMGNNPSHFKDSAQLPVETVSWDDAQAFIQQLKVLMPQLPVSLPTEAQWEYACRAGTTTPFSFGENVTPKQVNYDGNYPYHNGKKGLRRGKTVAVKSLPPNAWGLHEMHGNVWEWCEDVYRSDLGDTAAVDSISTALDAPASGTLNRVLRGGSWNDFGWSVRSAYRFSLAPDNRLHNLGFRLALGHIELRQGGGAGGAEQRQNVAASGAKTLLQGNKSEFYTKETMEFLESLRSKDGLNVDTLIDKSSTLDNVKAFFGKLFGRKS